MRARLRRFAWAAALLLASSAALGAGRSYKNDALRIAAFEVPRGWTVEPQPGYPRLLLLATQHATEQEVARLLLAAQKVVPGATSLALAADARAVLLRQGFADVRIRPLAPRSAGDERTRLDAAADGGKRRLWQAYAVDGDVAVVVTMIVPAGKTGQSARSLEQDFDSAADSLQLAPPPPQPPAATTPPATLPATSPTTSPATSPTTSPTTNGRDGGG